MATINNGAVIIRICTQRIGALDTHVQNKTEIAIDGERRKAPDVKAVYQECLDASAEVTAKRGELKAALARRDAAESERLVTDEGLKAWVSGEFGLASPEAQIG